MSGRITIADISEAKRDGRKLVAVSCYDYSTALLVGRTDVDILLVGDSAAMLVLGHESTLPATMDFMVMITAAVRRGAPEKFVVADMPFMSYQTSVGDAVRNAGRFAAEAGAQMIKIEVTGAHQEVVRAVSDAGLAVMGHIGIKPQMISKVGRFRAEATTAAMAFELISLAERLVEAGASALLLEGTAAEVAQVITERVEVPVISCGSGSGCDGQVLVAPDILGWLVGGKMPKFSKAYGELGEAAVRAFEEYAGEVRAGRFPDDAHSYHMKEGEFEVLRGMLGE